MCKVNVLMSTYNGEKYLREQIVSIMEQTLSGVELLVRDDGSTDDTVSVIEKLREEYPGRITLIEGENIGYRKSFLALLATAAPADYYAFADQDDVWLPEKCEVAVRKLSEAGACLYSCALDITDEDLNVKSRNTYPKLTVSLASFLVRNRFPGCAMVFDREVKDLATKFATQHPLPEELPTHDALVSACACVVGDIVVDEDAYILHRRLSDSVSGGGRGIRKRISVEAAQVFGEKYTHYRLARFLLSYAKGYLKPEDRELLIDIVSYHKNRGARKRLRKSGALSSGMTAADLETKIKLWIRNY